jgi:hypothetical protein
VLVRDQQNTQRLQRRLHKAGTECTLVTCATDPGKCDTKEKNGYVKPHEEKEGKKNVSSHQQQCAQLTALRCSIEERQGLAFVGWSQVYS